MGKWFEAPAIMVGESRPVGGSRSIVVGVIGGLTVAGLLVGGLFAFSYVATQLGYGEIES